MVVLWAVAMFAYLIVVQVNLAENRALNMFARSVLTSRVGEEKGMKPLAGAMKQCNVKKDMKEGYERAKRSGSGVALPFDDPSRKTQRVVR